MIFKWLRKRKVERCEQTGHELTERKERRFYEWPSEYGAADRVRIEIKSCKCGQISGENELRRSTITSLSMGIDDWDKLKDDGRLYR